MKGMVLLFSMVSACCLFVAVHVMPDTDVEAAMKVMLVSALVAALLAIAWRP